MTWSPHTENLITFLNEGAKRGASQCVDGFGDASDEPESSTKVRSVELRNGRALGRVLDFPTSSTKVRSVELRNNGSPHPGQMDASPQRRCEAWSFAIVIA